MGGPKNKTILICSNTGSYTITIDQYGGSRQISIISPQEGITKAFLSIYYDLETLLMLLDGQFYPVTHVFEDGVDITLSWKRRTLPSYHSADFMLGAQNVLVDFNEVLEPQLLFDWSNLRNELDLIHKVVLYCLSSVEMPKDMQCTFMTEIFEGLSELVHEKKPEFILPKIKKGDSKLQNYLLEIIPAFGTLIFEREMQCNLEAFTQILVNSRNRIAHVKSKQKRTYLRDGQNLIYLMKMSLFYRTILFQLLEIPEGLYKQKLTLRVQAINDHKVTQEFLKQLSECIDK